MNESEVMHKQTLVTDTLVIATLPAMAHPVVRR
jgi:hypothetical protein